jgi:signal transduction histidine kinase
MGRRAKPAKVKAEAKRVVVPKSSKNEDFRVRDLEKELEARNRDLAEALERQTAAGEVLRVISNSPTDVQPVFDMIAARAITLCEAELSLVQRSDGEQLHLAAIHGVDPAGVEFARTSFPMPLSTESCGGRAVRTRGVVHLADVLNDPTYALKEQARAMRFRSGLAVPMLRDEQMIGAVYVGRSKPGLFSDTQVALLQTFAEQAVIAIENVRLFTELQASNRELTSALDTQTATSDILRVISQSTTDVQPVFDVIVENACRLCDGVFANAVSFDGVLMHNMALYGFSPEAREMLLRAFPQSATRESMSGRAILNCAVVQSEDMSTDVETRISHQLSRLMGFRAQMSVPMLRDGVPVGAITLARRERGPFPERQVDLLRTFADQAVIAIENVRLFTELQASNRELTTALDTQTATSDILRVISRSQTDVQPVFDAILASAVRLLGAYSGALTLKEGDRVELVALASTDDAGDAALRAAFPQSLLSEGPPVQAIRNRAPLNIADAHTDPRVPETQHGIARVRGYRSLVAVPLLRHDTAVGSITVTRRESGGFTGDEIALLQTFADQAVIAIENARLFKELKARTHDLTRSVGELRALAEVGQAVSSTLDLNTVLTTIVSRAVQLSSTDGGSIYEYDEAAEEFTLRATHNLDAPDIELRRAIRLKKGEGATGCMAITHEPVQLPDISTEGAYDSRLREVLLCSGARAVLAVPILREDHFIGSLVVSRNTPGTFPTEIVELLKTFASQSALAIQNARLFREIEEKSHQLEVASQHKSEFLANMSHELRTPLNAIIGFSEVLTERMFGELNEKQDEYLKDIYASGQHLLSLINDILDLSKIEAGRMELEPTDFDLPSALDNALTLVRERAGRRGITLGRAIDERVGTIRADERKVKQVLLNLLSNALKFTPEGGRIDVRAAVTDGMAEVSVADTGVGIAPEDQEAVFEEFRQVGTADKKVEGTGLGLALSRKFIELHGGRIWVKSQVGTGSTFTFTIPVRGEPRDRGGAPTLNS